MSLMRQGLLLNMRVPCLARLKKRPWLLGLRAFFVLVERSRGTNNLSRLCRAGSPDLDPFTAHPLASPNYFRLILFQTIGLAGDRPLRYGKT